MNIVTATRVIALSIVLLWNSFNCMSQVIDKYVGENESIEIDKVDNNKINIFIFIDATGDSVAKNDLLNGLNTINIEYKNFNIFRFFVTPVTICPPNKRLILDGYDNLPAFFHFNPYYILIKTDIKRYEEIVSSKLNNDTSMLFTAVNKDNQASPFKRITNIQTLFTLLKEDDDTFNYRFAIQKLENELATNRYKIDSLTNILTHRAYSNQLEVNISYGTFTEQLKKSNNTLGHARQSFEYAPTYVKLTGAYKRCYSNSWFIKAGLELSFYNTGIYSKSLKDFTSSEYNAIKSTNPIANSTSMYIGIGLATGYKLNNFLLFNRKCHINLDFGISYNKMVYGISKADFYILNSDGTTATIQNSSNFTDQFSLYLITNPTIEFPLDKDINIQLGFSALCGVSVMNTPSQYQLINNKNQYVALENASQNIFFQGVGLIAGILYTLQ